MRPVTEDQPPDEMWAYLADFADRLVALVAVTKRWTEDDFASELRGPGLFRIVWYRHLLVHPLAGSGASEGTLSVGESSVIACQMFQELAEWAKPLNVDLSIEINLYDQSTAVMSESAVAIWPHVRNFLRGVV